jgi:hypothetical protein
VRSTASKARRCIIGASSQMIRSALRTNSAIPSQNLARFHHLKKETLIEMWYKEKKKLTWNLLPLDFHWFFSGYSKK